MQLLHFKWAIIRCPSYIRGGTGLFHIYAGHILLNLYPTEFDGVKEHKVTPVLEVEMFK